VLFRSPTYPRHPHAMAQQAASTGAAARGRFTLGVGPSHRVVVEDTWGLSYERAYAHTGEYLSVLVPLLRTGKVEHAGTRFTVRAHLTSTDGLPVPVLLSGLGPKMLGLAGTPAAGTLTWLVGSRTPRRAVRARRARRQARHMPSRAGGDRGTAVGASAAVRRAFVVTRLIDHFNAMVGGDAPGSAVGRLVGFRPTSIEPGKAIFELEAGPQHANPMGTLHGGIICDVADAAMGTADASTLGDGARRTPLELK